MPAGSDPVSANLTLTNSTSALSLLYSPRSSAAVNSSSCSMASFRASSRALYSSARRWGSVYFSSRLLPLVPVLESSELLATIAPATAAAASRKLMVSLVVASSMSKAAMSYRLRAVVAPCGCRADTSRVSKRAEVHLELIGTRSCAFPPGYWIVLLIPVPVAAVKADTLVVCVDTSIIAEARNRYLATFRRGCRCRCREAKAPSDSMIP
mmetsp:Transcript_16791/g.36476  ORF Transcript_16791/g.36476 Transcript_16791/m.36476 type:complete len:210 (-) Transcript_16791:119-748(-)